MCHGDGVRRLGNWPTPSSHSAAVPSPRAPDAVRSIRGNGLFSSQRITSYVRPGFLAAKPQAQERRACFEALRCPRRHWTGHDPLPTAHDARAAAQHPAVPRRRPCGPPPSVAVRRSAAVPLDCPSQARLHTTRESSADGSVEQRGSPGRQNREGQDEQGSERVGECLRRGLCRTGGSTTTSSHCHLHTHTHTLLYNMPSRRLVFQAATNTTPYFSTFRHKTTSRDTVGPVDTSGTRTKPATIRIESSPREHRLYTALGPPCCTSAAARVAYKNSPRPNFSVDHSSLATTTNLQLQTTLSCAPQDIYAVTNTACLLRLRDSNSFAGTSRPSHRRRPPRAASSLRHIVSVPTLIRFLQHRHNVHHVHLHLRPPGRA